MAELVTDDIVDRLTGELSCPGAVWEHQSRTMAAAGPAGAGGLGGAVGYGEEGLVAPHVALAAGAGL
jgi:hypothetical protein